MIGDDEALPSAMVSSTTFHSLIISSFFLILSGIMGPIRGEDELDVDVDVGKVHVYISPKNVVLPLLQWSPQSHLPPQWPL